MPADVVFGLSHATQLTELCLHTSQAECSVALVGAVALLACLVRLDLQNLHVGTSAELPEQGPLWCGKRSADATFSVADGVVAALAHTPPQLCHLTQLILAHAVPAAAEQLFAQTLARVSSLSHLQLPALTCVMHASAVVAAACALPSLLALTALRLELLRMKAHTAHAIAESVGALRALRSLELHVYNRVCRSPHMAFQELPVSVPPFAPLADMAHATSLTALTLIWEHGVRGLSAA